MVPWTADVVAGLLPGTIIATSPPAVTAGCRCAVTVYDARAAVKPSLDSAATGQPVLAALRPRTLTPRSEGLCADEEVAAMRIFITGSTGVIGRRVVPEPIGAGPGV